MPKKNVFSKKTLTVVEYVWFIISMMTGAILKDNLNLNFGVYMCITSLLYIIGETLIRKFIKVNK